MDGSQIIRRALRVAEECEIDVALVVDDDRGRTDLHGKLSFNHEDDEVFIAGEFVSIEDILSVVFKRNP